MVFRVYFARWRPFSTDEGNRDVFRLIADYDERLNAVYRDTFKMLSRPGQPSAGGFLQDHRAWFVKGFALPQLKINLSLIGVKLLPKYPSAY